MTRSLRKACQSCTRVKRRCIVQLPKCHRCQVRQLDCVYDLEPLLTDVRASSKSRIQVERTAVNAPKQVAFRNSFLHFVSSKHLDPERTAIGFIGNPNSRHLIVSKVPLSADSPTVEYMVGELLRVAHAMSRSQPSPFIHAHLPPRPQAMVLSQEDWGPQRSLGPRDSNESRGRVTLDARMRQLLLSLNDPAVSVRETVHNFQAFICHMIWFLFFGDRRPSQLKEKLLEHMRRVATRMIRDAPRLMATNLSRWHTWLVAESLRRAVLMSCLVQGIYYGWVRGFCYHELFIQALPFDVRPGLWNADSEEEWEALLAEAEPPPELKSASSELVSFNEFASSFARAPFDPGSDSFQRLLLIAHHGKGPVDRALGSSGSKAAAATSPTSSV